MKRNEELALEYEKLELRRVQIRSEYAATVLGHILDRDWSRGEKTIKSPEEYMTILDEFIEAAENRGLIPDE